MIPVWAWVRWRWTCPWKPVARSSPAGWSRCWAAPATRCGPGGSTLERRETDHGDLDVGAARRDVGDRVAGAGTQDGPAQRGLGAVDGQVGGGRDLPRAEQERLGVVLVVVEVDGHDRARGHRVGLGCLAHVRPAQQLLQVADPPLLLALLLAGGVVTAVLPQVTLFASGVDLRGDHGPMRDELVEFGLQPVVRVLGQPRPLAIGHSAISSAFRKRGNYQAIKAGVTPALL